jgi:hypothetical protein
MRGFAANVTAAQLEKLLAPYIADRQAAAVGRDVDRSDRPDGDNGSSKSEGASGWPASGDLLTR